MSTKTIPFKQPMPLPKPAEAWVGNTDVAEKAPPKPDLPTKRLTVDVPEDLHRRIKVQCAMKDVQISDVVRDILSKEFPAA